MDYKNQYQEININSFPYPVLLKILSFLSVEDRVLDACLVCKLWHDVCFDEIFWRSIDFSHRRLLSDEVLKRSVLYSNNIHTLSLSCSMGKTVTREGILDAISCCPKLKCLNIKYALFEHLGEETVVKISELCPSLETLKVFNQRLTDDGLINGIAKNLKSLKYLDVSENRITDTGLIAVVENCPDLTGLRVNQVKGVTDELLKVLAEREKQIPTMTDLILSMTGVSRDCSIYLQHFTSLTQLSLTHIKGISHKEMFIIVSNATRIEQLMLGMIKSVDDKCIEIVSEYLKDLFYIDIASTGITDVALSYLASKSKKLKRIDMAYTSITHEGVENVCENLPALKYLGLLRCDEADEMEVELVIQRFPSIFFMTFLQDARRMLIKLGKWVGEKTGIVTHEKIRNSLDSPNPGARTKPRRIMGTGGEIEYVTYSLPGE